MMPVQVGPYVCGAGQPLLLIAGPCVIESEEHAREMAAGLREIAGRVGINLVYKASFDKANRTSGRSFRGPGLKEGLKILERIREDYRLPVLSDIHETEQAKPAGEVLDIIQIPAFLCRQTDLLVAAAKTGKVVNIKKGQFLAPWDMKNVVDKVREAGNNQVLLTERGVSFGYNTLVVDMRSLPIMRGFGVPVIFDGTHSVQQPGGQGTCSGGQREFVPVLTRAAVAAGVDGIFLEVHNRPELAKSDGPNMIALDQLESLLKMLLALHDLVRPVTAGEGVN
ncbi:MAG TPA: 3-deoxy-8-phosphooctulonate synthase [Firmicutes bacterium]|jgi:2-dehydro-3-deoxyphosphooctonate aldolase (KDO 8-P synthase)|nr:3-deoxy-8-phosphooctulonate synthase [Bacillota bacterium]HOQ23174.1 3-deoxy-8-phosphooctulonate synthase [Bacillota bacterium]HPT66603.1 3-deoxy-8-phosphooctulonate synthase [Bacillota bacterium]